MVLYGVAPWDVTHESLPWKCAHGSRSHENTPESLVVAMSWVAHVKHVSGKNSKKGSKRPKSLGDLSCYGSGNAGGFGGGHFKGIHYPGSTSVCRIHQLIVNWLPSGQLTCGTTPTIF